MKRIRLIELLAEIKANAVAFFSIMMFVCLGIGLFLGIQWGGVALGGEVERVFEVGRMHDIEVQFPYGVTEEDAQRVAALDGVTEYELGYTSYVRVPDGNARRVFKMQGLTERIDLPTVVEGRLPAKADELALLSFWAEDHGYKVGDRITLVHDADDEDDADGMANLTCDSFTVCGLVEHPAYLSVVDGALGVAGIGSGTVDCVAFVTTDAFDVDSFEDGYPVLYLRCDGLRGKNTFTKAYRESLDPITDEVTKLGATLGAQRYRHLRDEAQGKIDDAAADIADGEHKIDDAHKEIADGAQEIADAERELADGEKELADGERELDDAADQLADGARQLDEAEGQLADGSRQISDAERQLADGEQEVAAGEQRVADAEQQLAAGERELAEKRAQAQQKMGEAQKELDEAKADLDAYQEAYDTSVETYNSAKAKHDDMTEFVEALRPASDAANGCVDTLDPLADDLQSAEGDLESAVASYHDVMDDPEATEEDKAAAWDGVVSAYDTYKALYQSTAGAYAALQGSMQPVCAIAGVAMPVFPELPALPELTPETVDEAREAASAACEAVFAGLENVYATSVNVDGEDFWVLSIVGGYDEATAELESGKAELDAMKEELDAGWAEYDAKKRQFDEEVAAGEAQLADAERKLAAGRAEVEGGRAEVAAGRNRLSQGYAELSEARATYRQKLAEFEQARATYREKLAEYEQARQDLEQGRVDLEEGRQKLEDAKRELDDAKRELAEKEAELADAKARLDEAQEQLDSMEEYEWLVFPRLENGGASSVSTISTMMSNVRWAMALLFVLIGLFVCYSAVSRLVNDEVVQIGTKKAVGFREREVSAEYLSFSGIAVLVGTLFAGVLAVFVVEGIMNPASANSFTLPDFPPHFNPFELLVGGGIELVLILLSTWLAIHGLLKLNAIELLNGGEEKAAKLHFYENTKLWKGLPLFTQTIINNCVNDTRRVAATLIGVMGCTALIVTAVTLSGNVSESMRRHYERVYDFDTLVYLDTDVDGAVGKVSKALAEAGVASAPAHVEKLQVRQPDGYRAAVSLYVPYDTALFESRYHINSIDGGEADLGKGGIWVSRAYAEHMGLDVGDTVRVTEGTGRTHEFEIGGVFEYYLLRNEFLMGPDEFNSAFGEDATTNVLLAQAGDHDLDQLQGELLKVEGYDSLVNDRSSSEFAFGEMESLLRTVVSVYLMLSALMAIVVLLNLDIMFVDEKKRELIVLMINGFSTGDAKAYIYRDSIFLTVIGIVLGVVFGSVMGGVTVKALEPLYGYFVRDFNMTAALVGIAGASIFSTAVLLIALRKIPRFELTDINRF